MNKIISLLLAGVISLAENGWLPDFLIRKGIKFLCGRRLNEQTNCSIETQCSNFSKHINLLKNSEIAIHTDIANQQHYELPPQFFKFCLGKRLKYSCALYNNEKNTLDEAEEAMLQLYEERAELKDGQQILELGCGWGSLTLWLAERFPNSFITSVSNSSPQREHIENQCMLRNIKNVKVITCDVNNLILPHNLFDRCISIEMFEHMRNYEILLSNIQKWLTPGGKLFVHIFCHRTLLYPFENSGEDNWMGRYFFTGGLMPSADTLLYFQEKLQIEERYLVNGINYYKTCNDWLVNQDKHRKEIIDLFKKTYGEKNAILWFNRWRIFYMACAEMFNYDNGNEWMVAHYRFIRK
jgi:cyclopropane-fatty-acyl-phospholipid synthase